MMRERNTDPSHARPYRLPSIDYLQLLKLTKLSHNKLTNLLEMCLLERLRSHEELSGSCDWL